MFKITVKVRYKICERNITILKNNDIKIILSNTCKYVNIYIIDLIFNVSPNKVIILRIAWVVFRVGFRVSTRSVEPWQP